MSSPEDQWLDHDAGPVVRPYALTGGRTRPSGESFDLIAVVSVVAGLPSDPPGLEPEHVQVLHRCRTPTSVADLASDLDLPLGVIRILLADLRERGLIRIQRPAANHLVDARILQQVADGLRRLLLPGPALGRAGDSQDPYRGRLRLGKTTLVSSVTNGDHHRHGLSAGSPPGMIC
jgi:hypothetical protein